MSGPGGSRLIIGSYSAGLPPSLVSLSALMSLPHSPSAADRLTVSQRSVEEGISAALFQSDDWNEAQLVRDKRQGSRA